MSLWKKMERLSTLLQIAVGLVILAPIVGGPLILWRDKLPEQLPIWCFPIVAFVCLLLGALIVSKGLNRGYRTRAQDAKVIGSIGFNYQTPNPRLHSWKVSTSKTTPEPVFELQNDGRLGRVLNVKPMGSYGMDYDIPPYLSHATSVDVVLRPAGEWFVCFYVSVEPSTPGSSDEFCQAFRVRWFGQNRADDSSNSCWDKHEQYPCA